MARYGIATAGNWIVDRVKLINRWPEEETLSLIEDEQLGGGGGAYNCIVDLHQLGVGYPLAGVGCVGDDTDGAWLRERLTAARVDQTWIRARPEAPTSYTDVMSVTATGRRTFFHCVGANGLLGPDDFPAGTLEVKLLHLAYLLVLPQLDALDPDDGCVGAGVLRRLRAEGIITCLDLITEDSPRVQQILRPALRHVDHLICNELEAGVISGIPTRTKAVIAGKDGDIPRAEVTSVLNPAGLRAAAKALLESGVNRSVIVHMPEGGYLVDRDGCEWFQPSLALPPDFIVGANGAGDAFAAGVLHGLHEEWQPGEILRLAVATAAASLRHATTTAGVGPLAETLSLLATYPEREVNWA